MAAEKKKRCFVITPIGDEGSEIRRHIDGIIHAVIHPAIEDKYEIVAAHEINKLGSITKQIINEIYSADLVIANLTDRNPNVMYELAFRHTLGKPAIIIAEKGTSLPSDIILERTIFYTNDAQGVLDLRDKLKETEADIKFNNKQGPIYETVENIRRETEFLKLAKRNEDAGAQDSLAYILQRLDSIENSINSARAESRSPNFSQEKMRVVTYVFSYAEAPDVDSNFLFLKLRDATHSVWQAQFSIKSLEWNQDIKTIDIAVEGSPVRFRSITTILTTVLKDVGFKELTSLATRSA